MMIKLRDTVKYHGGRCHYKVMSILGVNCTIQLVKPESSLNYGRLYSARLGGLCSVPDCTKIKEIEWV